MTRKIFSFFMVIFLLGLCFQTLSAQAKEQKTQLFAVWDVVVSPSKFMEYEAAVKQILDYYTKHKCPYPYSIYRTHDFHYYWIMPVKNMAGIDKMFQYFEEVEKKAGEEAETLGKQYSKTYESDTFGTFYLRYDLSYLPEKPRIKPEEISFVWWSYYYIKPGNEAEAGKIAKEYKALYKKHNIPDGFSIYMAGMWSDLPVMVVAGSAKSISDFYAQQAKNAKLFGEEVKTLAKKAMDGTRKYEHKTGYFLKYLSYFPPKAEK